VRAAGRALETADSRHDGESTHSRAVQVSALSGARAISLLTLASGGGHVDWHGED
jgi:hypothetical protein